MAEQQARFDDEDLDGSVPGGPPADIVQSPLLIVVTSTYGNGDPPVNAEDLMDWLRQDDASVAGTRFAVCGLGDLAYPKFCQAGKDFDPFTLRSPRGPHPAATRRTSSSRR